MLAGRASRGGPGRRIGAVLIVLISRVAAQDPGRLQDADLLRSAAEETKACAQALAARQGDLEASATAAAEWTRAVARATASAPLPIPDTAEAPDTLEGLGALVEACQGVVQALSDRRQGALDAVRAAETRVRLAQAIVQREKDLALAVGQASTVLEELDRRLASGRIDPGVIHLDPLEPDLAAWRRRLASIAPAAEAEPVAQASLAQVEAASLRPVEPKEEQAARRAASVASLLQDARRNEEAEWQALASAEAGSIAALAGRLAAEWKQERDAFEAARRRSGEGRGALQELDERRRALVPPARDSLPEPEGPEELRRVRRDEAHAGALAAFAEARLQLLREAAARAQDQRNNLLDQQAAFDRLVRLTVRLRAVLRRVAPEGAAPGDSDLGPELTPAALWGTARRLAQAEAGLREELAQVDARLGDASVVEGAERELEAAQQEHRRLQAVVREEESYAALVADMRTRSTDALLALLVPSGEMAQALSRAQEELRVRERAAAQAENRLRAARIAVTTLENPYTQAVIRSHRARAAELRAEIQALAEGALPQDAVSAPEERSPAADPRSPGGEDVDAAAQVEREKRILETEQALKRELLRYFEDLAAGTQAWEAAVAAHEAAVAEQAAALTILVQEEKRRHACALELVRRRAPPSRLPRELGTWITRDAVTQAQNARDELMRRTETARSRRRPEQERIAGVLAWTPWVRADAALADRRATLMGRPAALIAAARTAFPDMKEVERKSLEYRALSLRAAEDRGLDAWLVSFTSAGEKRRYEDPLHAFYVELVANDRRLDDYRRVLEVLEELVRATLEAREVLAPVPALLREAEPTRLLEYHAARYLAAAAAHPGSLTRIQNDFKAAFRRELPLPIDAQGWDKRAWADHLFAVECRLRGHRQWLQAVETDLSKIGLEAAVGRYRGIMAKISADSAAVEAERTQLLGSIGSLRDAYSGDLRRNAVRAALEVLLIPTVAWLLVRLLRRGVRRIEERNQVEGSSPDAQVRERRIRTLAKAFLAAMKALIWGFAGIYVVRRLGVDVTPIVASASVVGLAVAFGAQALIRDFFSGFFILLENQYTLGDVVDLGNVTGTVERMTLRVTVVRDIEGVVHYIPNGTVNRVANKTQDWSQVVLQVSVGYREDTDRVSAVLEDVLLRMYEDPRWGARMLDRGKVAGVDALGDSSVNIRVMVKVRPGRQWDVARELRRRIKHRFDKDGIEIPFPQRVVRHVSEVAPPTAAKPAPAPDREAPQAAAEAARPEAPATPPPVG
jgi:small-conductance mechanosensitive channel